jgi:hypothetical protein
MSQENVDLVKGLLGTAESMDKEAMLAALPDLMPQLCDPEVEWIEDPQRADGRRLPHDGREGPGELGAGG